MEFGYPGANTSIESHGVSEESFWPSFTDIMMVIVMVFLLVTVAVILNNWSLIADLKNSIAAQEIASNLAENRLVENDSLGSKLSQLEGKIVTLNDKYEQEKSNLIASQELLEENKQVLIANQEELSQTLQKVVEKDAALTALQAQIKILNNSLMAEKLSLSNAQQQLLENKQKLTDKETALAKLETDLSDVAKQKDELAQLNKSHNNTLAENVKVQQTLREELNTSNSTITNLEKQQAGIADEIETLKQSDEIKSQILVSLQSERTKLEETVSLLKTDYTKSQEATQTEKAQTEAIKEKLAELEQAQQQQKVILQSATDSNKMSEESLKALEKEKQRIIVSMSEKLTGSEEKIANLEASIGKFNEKVKIKDSEILALKENTQLLSLQGKYDTLDAKYQKLLRPARSSKGKYIVSVTYKKKAGKSVIRLKSSPDGSYKTVTKKELATALEKLKAKHKADLYMKVIIPETSGLSYSEAWKFTSNLQKRYDYYHQPSKSK